MFGKFAMHKNEKGQTALETAIILIAFVVVASVFAFTILSAGSSSTEKGKQAIQAGLEGVQSSMNIKGSVIAQGSGGNVDDIIFTLSLVAGGSPVNMSTADKEVVIGYKDAEQFENDVSWDIAWIVSKQTPADDLLEEGELAELTVDLGSLGTPLSANTAFNLEIKPPKGAVLNLNRTTPAAIQPVMDLN
ncbi:MAG: flagellin [Chloroflexi bacterium]|nr:flagellin [Chloroflexota bacterium]